MGYSKSLIILKDIKKPRSTFLHVWAKSQWRLNFVWKFWNLNIKSSMENWIFVLFLSHLPWPLPFYTALENNTIFYNNFFGFVGGGRFPPPPCGRPWIIQIANEIISLSPSVMNRNIIISDPNKNINARLNSI